MGGVTGLIGAGGGAGGTSFAGPQAAQIQSPTTNVQAATAYTQNQAALQQQQQLLQAIQAQGGLQNQSNVYNQLQGVANGTGPNPAQAQLAQATGQNVANQAALAAGQRGANANVGLIARQAAQQGSAAQQNAAGQAATLQANQSLNAINSAGNIANTQAQNQIGATSANTAAQQGEQNALLNAIQGQNQAQVSSQASINAANAGLANTQLQGQQGLIGGGISGIGTAMGLAKGGVVPKKMADGGSSTLGVDTNMNLQAPTIPAPAISNPSNHASNAGKFLSGFSSMGSSQTQNPMLQGGQALGAGIGKGLKALFSSSKPSGTPSPADSTQLNTMGNGPGIQAPAAQALPDGTRTAARGGKIDTKDKLKAGGPVPGKAKVKGDSLKNDNVKALLSPGEIVVPRSIATHPHAPELAAKFVAATLAKQGMKRRG